MDSKLKPTLFILAGFVLVFAACAAPAEIPAIDLTPAPANAAADSQPVTTVSFANDILPILQNHCFKCHGGKQTKEGLDLGSYASLMAGSDNGSVLIPGDAANSLLVQQLLNGKMPKRGPKLTPDQIQLIINWINAGALNN